MQQRNPSEEAVQIFLLLLSAGGNSSHNLTVSLFFRVSAQPTNVSWRLDTTALSWSSTRKLSKSTNRWLPGPHERRRETRLGSKKRIIQNLICTESENNEKNQMLPLNSWVFVFFLPGCYEHHGQSSVEIQRQRVFLQGLTVSLHCGWTKCKGETQADTECLVTPFCCCYMWWPCPCLRSSWPLRSTRRCSQPSQTPESWSC